LEGHIWKLHTGETEEEIAEGQLLSENRAKNIQDFLIRKGISSDRLSYVGYGSDRPLPISIKNGALNRRVEIRILEK